MSEDPWKLLRAGRDEGALDALRDAFTREETPSHITELGIAHLWVRDYTTASAHFGGVISKYPKHAAIFYGMAGVAQWCLNDRRTAVAQWRAGLHCDFADGAGGITIPLLLFFASVVAPKACSRAEAEDLLIERANDPRVRVWP